MTDHIESQMSGGSRRPDNRSRLAFPMPYRSVGLKLLFVCFLALLLAIPSLFIYDIVVERSSGAEMAVRTVSEKVGGQQTVLGPVLIVPYSYVPNPERPDRLKYGRGVVYAETGLANVSMMIEDRQRGIHSVPVYTADIDFAAEFRASRILGAIPPGALPVWQDVQLYFGVSDRRGIREPFTASLNGSLLDIGPADQGTQQEAQYKPLPATRLSLATAELETIESLSGRFSVTANMMISGAERFALAPFAKDTEMTVTSDWASPSFEGGVLPLRHNVGENTDGFSAQWSVPYLARGVLGAGPGLDINALLERNVRDMAIRFVKPGNPYQSVQRALKYAVMFVGFVFLAYFLFEVTSGARAHPAQYVLVGLAQSIFYLLLLALAEQIGFDASFAIAASMTIILTASYSAIVFRSRAYGLRAFGILCGIYGLIYILMRAEDLALLAGAFASFIAIALTMWLTRHVDWYGAGETAPA